MFTGTIRGIGRIAHLNLQPGMTKFAVIADPACLTNLQKGASVAIDGVCLTVVKYDDTTIWFDAIAETLKRTTLKSLHDGQLVNLERAAKFGDEIGGHLLSGHISCTAQVVSIEKAPNNVAVTFQCPKEWMKYLFPKGYIALNGTSLTIVDVNRDNHSFSIHLIPETLQNTTFGSIKSGDLVNVEFDTQTQTVVDTLERIHKS